MTVIWITGLSGSGKSTIAERVFEEIKDCGKECILLDGDEIRNVLSMEAKGASNTSKMDRVLLGLKYSKLARLLSNQGHIVIVATISLFKEIHEWNRLNIKQYIEIFMEVKIEELIRRDTKSIYKNYLDGKVKNVAGMDLEVDFPRNPDYILCYNGEDVRQSARRLIDFLKEHDHENKLGLFKAC